jgi:hypothetical protein
METEQEYIKRTRVRWFIYNWIFRILGRTKYWHKLQDKLW